MTKPTQKECNLTLNILLIDDDVFVHFSANSNEHQQLKMKRNRHSHSSSPRDAAGAQTALSTEAVKARLASRPRDAAGATIINATVIARQCQTSILARPLPLAAFDLFAETPKHLHGSYTGDRLHWTHQ